MKCFNHHSEDAVAICKSCNKGLCIQCATEVENLVSCKGKCQEEVKILNEMIQRNKTLLNKNAASYYRISIIYAIAGIVFLTFGLFIFDFIPSMKYFSMAFGFVMFIAAVLLVISGKKIKSK